MNERSQTDGSDVSTLFVLGFLTLAIGLSSGLATGAWALVGTPPFGAWFAAGTVCLSGALLMAEGGEPR